MNKKSVLDFATSVLDIELEGIKTVRDKLDYGFVKAVELIFACTGRVVVTGVGKSGLIGKKIAATMASTGTPAIFLHPVEALHGDLGVVSPFDCVIGISNSGETEELLRLLPVFRERNIPLVALTGKPSSTLARISQAVIDTGVNREACSLGLAPTSSTTATLAVGDALAITLLKQRGFNAKDFRRNHPAGSLGEALKLEVREIMLTGDIMPVVRTGSSMSDALKELDAKRIGCVLITEEADRLAGILTDGDIRREITKGRPIMELKTDDVMTKKPKCINPSVLAADAMAVMEQHLITVLPVVDENDRLCGVVHLHDLLGKGQFRFTGTI